MHPPRRPLALGRGESLTEDSATVAIILDKYEHWIYFVKDEAKNILDMSFKLQVT